jgi:hypothetical protein
MRLIGVLGVCGKLSEIPPNAPGGRKIEKTLETEHGLEQFRTIPHRRREATLDLPATETEPLA